MSQLYARPSGFKHNDFSGTAVNTTAYVEMFAVAATGDGAQMIEIFNTSTSILKIALGAAGAEIDAFLIPPAGTGFGGHLPRQHFNINEGVRISARAVDANATVGDLIINLWGR